MPHEFKEKMEVDVELPDHEQRKRTAKFEHARHQMIEVEKQTCWVCGTSEELELHHWVIEDCLANAVDFSEGSKLRQDFPEFDWASFKEPQDFVSDRVNMRVFCKKHHTGVGTSIHRLPYPVFNVQRYLKADFNYIVTPPVAPAADKKPFHQRVLHAVKKLVTKP